MSAKNFMSYGDAETVFTAIANAIKNNEDAVAAVTSALAAIKDGTDIDSFGDVEVALLDKADTSDLGTAAAKDSTNSVTSGSTDLVESGAVKDAIDAAVSSAYHHAGTKTVAQLTHDLLIAANEGNVYNITDSGTTTSDFIEGIGKTIDEGSNVGICKVGNVYMFDLLSGFVDTTNFVQKSVTAGLLKNDGTVNDEIEGDVSTLKSGLTNLDDNFTDVIGWDERKNLSVSQQNNTDLAHLPAGTYTISYKGNFKMNLDVKYDDESSWTRLIENVYAPQTFVLSKSGTVNLNAFSNDIYDIQIEKGSTATAFEPYHPVIGTTVEYLEKGLANLTANKSGNHVNLKSYTSSNMYTIPKDGYIVVNSDTDSTGNNRVVVRDSIDSSSVANIYQNVAGTYQIDSLFVKAGLKVYVNTSTANSSIEYVPLSN